MKGKNEIQRKILEETDFIHCPRLGNSLKRLIEKNPDGIDEDRIAKVLMMSVEEVKELYGNAIEKLKNEMVEK